MNVYRYASAQAPNETWYDEMLVSGDRILVTGFSYEIQASELAVFRLDRRTGRLRREGVFRIASNDYYSGNNYATRLIGDNLIFYTPFQLGWTDDEEFAWPRVRPWRPEDDLREQGWLERRRRDRRAPRERLPDSAPPMLDGGDVYRPVELLDEPVIHAVSVCPLASAGQGALACRSTAMIGPGVREWYVTADYAYLWTGTEAEGSCRAQNRQRRPAIAEALRAIVYRLPLDGAPPGLITVRGTPPDQFSLQADSRNLYALVRLEPADCSRSYIEPAHLAFVTIPHSGFGQAIADLPETAFVALPGTPTSQVAARFTERYLVYGGLSGYRRGLPDPNEFMSYGTYETEYMAWRFAGMRPTPAVVVPIADPGRNGMLATGHTVIRADRLGEDIILTGYRDRDGLQVTLVGLDGRPHIASTLSLPGRYESEGRSHAFTSRIDPDGSSLMGLPTVPRVRGERSYGVAQPRFGPQLSDLRPAGPPAPRRRAAAPVRLCRHRWRGRLPR